MVRKFEFKNVNSSLQQQLQNDLKSINQNPKLDDKTNNSSRLSTDEYNKLSTESMSKTFKITDKSSVNRINTEAKDIAKDFKLEEGIQQSKVIIHHFKRL